METAQKMLAPKTEFVRRLSELTDTPLPEVRERIRALYIRGIGPSRSDPLSDTTMAYYLIAFLASATHLESAEAAERYGSFTPSVTLLGGTPNDLTASIGLFWPSIGSLAQILPSLMTSSVLTTLAHTIRVLAEDGPVKLLHLQATMPPHDEFRMRLRPDEGEAIDLTYRPSATAPKPRKPNADFPLRTKREMSGEVVASLACLATPDAILNKRRSLEVQGASTVDKTWPG